MKHQMSEIEALCRKRIIYLINEFCNGSQQEFADRAGIGKSSVSQYVNGSNSPGNITSGKIAAAFSVNPAWVMGFDVPKEINSASKDVPNGAIMLKKSDFHKIPVYGRVAAGEPIGMSDGIIGYVNIDDFAGGEDYYGLLIKGHSMEPDIKDGDTVIVKKQEDVESGEIAIVSVNGEDATCKRIKKYESGIRLVPINPAYEPIDYSNDEIKSMPITIMGKVVELKRRF